MYESTFNFSNRPFNSVPCPDHFFAVQSHQQAIELARMCVDRSKGPVVILGSVGMGKSLVLEMIGDSLKTRYDVIKLECSRLLQRSELLQSILFELGLPYAGLSEGELRLNLVGHLKQTDRANDGVLLLVDDADRLSVELIDELRLITNHVRDGRSIVQVVLAGTQKLEDSLADPKLASFSQRISSRTVLHPMNKSETTEFIHQQVQRAGRNGSEIFSDESCDEIYQNSDGCPRLINQLCDSALIIAASRNQIPIDRQVIREAWAETNNLPMPSPVQDVAENNDSGTTVVEFGQLDDESSDQFESTPQSSSGFALESIFGPQQNPSQEVPEGSEPEQTASNVLDTQDQDTEQDSEQNTEQNTDQGDGQDEPSNEDVSQAGSQDGWFNNEGDDAQDSIVDSNATTDSTSRDPEESQDDSAGGMFDAAASTVTTAAGVAAGVFSTQSAFSAFDSDPFAPQPSNAELEDENRESGRISSLEQEQEELMDAARGPQNDIFTQNVDTETDDAQNPSDPQPEFQSAYEVLGIAPPQPVPVDEMIPAADIDSTADQQPTAEQDFQEPDQSAQSAAERQSPETMTLPPADLINGWPAPMTSSSIEEQLGLVDPEPSAVPAYQPPSTVEQPTSFAEPHSEESPESDHPSDTGNGSDMDIPSQDAEDHGQAHDENTANDPAENANVQNFTDPFAENFEEEELLQDAYSPFVAQQNKASLDVTPDQISNLTPLDEQQQSDSAQSSSDQMVSGWNQGNTWPETTSELAIEELDSEGISVGNAPSGETNPVEYNNDEQPTNESFVDQTDQTSPSTNSQRTESPQADWQNDPTTTYIPSYNVPQPTQSEQPQYPVEQLPEIDEDLAALTSDLDSATTFGNTDFGPDYSNAQPPSDAQNEPTPLANNLMDLNDLLPSHQLPPHEPESVAILRSDVTGEARRNAEEFMRNFRAQQQDDVSRETTQPSADQTPASPQAPEPYTPVADVEPSNAASEPDAQTPIQGDPSQQVLKEIFSQQQIIDQVHYAQPTPPVSPSVPDETPATDQQESSNSPTDDSAETLPTNSFTNVNDGQPADSISMEYPVTEHQGYQQPGAPPQANDDRDLLYVNHTQEYVSEPQPEPVQPPAFPQTEPSTGNAQRMDYNQLFDQLRNLPGQQNQ